MSIDTGSIDDAIERGKFKSTQLRGSTFFVAWSGVLTLAWSGWTKELSRLKQTLNSEVDPALQRENPGSAWPKTSIACVADDAPAMSREEYDALRAAIGKFREAVTEARADVDELKVVVFGARCCEKRLSVRKMVRFESGDADECAIDEESRAYVDKVVKEGDAVDYVERVNQPGHRESHYCSGAGVTLVQDCGDTIGRLVDAFRAEVDAILPGRYRWFNRECLHITIRGLVN